MKKFLSLLVVLTVCIAALVIGASAATVVASGTCGDNLTWTLDGEGTLVISGQGEMAEYESYFAAPWYSSRKDITEIIISNGVTSVGQYAYYGCSGLTSVTIPNSMTSIGYGAFRACVSLTAVSIPDSVTTIGGYAFKSCTGLNSVVIPNSITSIDYGAFEDCTALTSVTIPNSVTSIGSRAFLGCAGLKSVTIPDGVASIGSSAFQDCSGLTSVTVPDSVKDISDYAFEGCTGLKSVVLGSVREIGTSAFDGCTLLSNITFNGAVTTVGESAFRYCSALKAVTLPEGLETIGAHAFRYCTGLKSVGIPYTVTSIGNYAFADCGGLKAVSSNGTQAEWEELTAAGTSLFPAGITMYFEPAITAQPQSMETMVGETVRFTVEAGGYGVAYRWQYRTSSTGTWKNTTLTGNKTPTLTVSATAGRDGYQYRCVVTADGTTLYSKAATLTVAGLGILTQPVSVEIQEGSTAQFTVEAKGSNLTYQWQYKVPGGTWVNSPATGNKTATLKVPATADRNGNQYRCKVTGGTETKYTDAATLTVITLKITGQPVSADANVGGTAKFTVKAEGEGLKYQWQYRVSPAGKWYSATASGNKTATLKVPATTSRDGYQYRCVITDGSGKTVISRKVTLMVVSPVITAQPKSVDADEGTTVKFTVAASGEGLTYQWQYKRPGGTWANSPAAGNKTATLKVPATLSRDGYRYRCIITDGSGNSVISNAAALTVN